MEKRYQDALTLRLEDAYLNGCSHITYAEIYRWYGVEKIAARTLRDLEARWQDITENEQGRLMKIDGRGGIFVFGEEQPSPVDPNSVIDRL